MAEFFSATRADNGNVVIINADAIEHVDINNPVPLPPLDDYTALTGDHLETITVHFIADDPVSPTLVGVQGSIRLAMSADRFRTVVKGADTAEKVASERKAELAKMTADRQKERDKANAAADGEERTVKRRAKAVKAPKAARKTRKAKA